MQVETKFEDNEKARRNSTETCTPSRKTDRVDGVPR